MKSLKQIIASTKLRVAEANKVEALPNKMGIRKSSNSKGLKSVNSPAPKSRSSNSETLPGDDWRRRGPSLTWGRTLDVMLETLQYNVDEDPDDREVSRKLKDKVNNVIEKVLNDLEKEINKLID
jgi:hypothetical protein